MLLNHLFGLYTHPKQEWHTIERRHESLIYSLSHILITALIPALCGYYGAVHRGFSIGVGEAYKLTPDSALFIASALYLALVAGVMVFAYVARLTARAFEVEISYTQALELAAYTSTPLMMVGFSALYPALWFMMLVGLAGLSYTIYLLYSGVPIMLHIPEEKGFVFSSAIVTAGLILLVIMMTSTAIIWTSGLIMPVFTH